MCAFSSFRIKLSRHFPLFILFFILVLGAVLRIHGLDRKSMWIDECLCVRLAEKSVQDQVKFTLYTSRDYHLHPPLYTILLQFFLYFGNNDYLARLPSAIFGVAAILLAYKVGTLLFGPKEGLISAFLLSISTFHIKYSQEAIMYSQFLFFSLLSIFFFYKAFKENKIRLWTGFVISTLLGLYTHFYMLIILVIISPFFIHMLYKNRSSILVNLRKLSKKKIFLLALALVFVSIFLIPILEMTLNIVKTGQLGREYGIPPESLFLRLFRQFSIDYGILLFFPTFLIGLFASIKKQRQSTTLLLLWVFLPILMILILAFTFGEEVYVTSRQMIFILPGYLIGVSRGISSIASSLFNWLAHTLNRFGHSVMHLPETKQMAISLLIAIVVFGSVSVNDLRSYCESENVDWRAAAEYLKTNAHPNDIAIVEPHSTCFLHYYGEGSEIIRIKSPDVEELFSSNLSSVDAGIWFISTLKKKLLEKGRNWLIHNCFLERKRSTGVIILYRPKGLIVVSTEVYFKHYNNSATFTVHLPKEANYTIAIHAKSSNGLTLELIVDETLKSFGTFIAERWTYLNFGTFFLESGSHKVVIINRSESGIQTVIDKVVIWPTMHA